MQTTLLNLANAAAQMDLMYRLEIAIAGDDVGVMKFIKVAIATKSEPTAVIIQMVKDMIRDNFSVMSDILGVQLVKRFIAFEFPEKPEDNKLFP